VDYGLQRAFRRRCCAVRESRAAAHAMNPDRPAATSKDTQCFEEPK